MIQDIIKIRPETKQNYYTGKTEFATPVVKPKEKAKYYFNWGLVFHARGKPAEAYKYYEKAITFNALPLYIKQMGILHHEMGYFNDAFRYLRKAFAIEKELTLRNKEEENTSCSSTVINKNSPHEVVVKYIYNSKETNKY
ncbi:MAG: tetratricopeptide repeat protein [Bacteroidales bacterium]